MLVKAMARVVEKRQNTVLVLVGEPWSGELAGVLGLTSALLEMLESPGRAARMASAASRFARRTLSQESFVEGVSRVLETTGGRN